MTSAPVRETVFVANIKSNPLMPAEYVRSDISTLFARAGERKAIAVFGAEIVATPPYYRRAWRRLGRAHRFRFFAGDEVPISLAMDDVVTTLSVLRHVLHLLTRGIALVSPNRYSNVLRTRLGGFKVAFVNTHLNPQAASASHPEQLAAQLAKVKATVGVLLRAGFTVVIGGDLNHVAKVVWAADQVQLLPLVGSMSERDLQLAVIPAAGVRVTAVDHGDVDQVHTDHPIRWASFELASA